MGSTPHSRRWLYRTGSRCWRLLLLLPIAALFPRGVVVAAPSGGNLTTVRSRSGQFVVQSPLQTSPSLYQPLATTNRNFITLQPDPVAVSAERIKQRFLREFDLQDHWQGKIHLNLHPNRRMAAGSVFAASRFGDGWQYSVELPEQLEPLPFVRAIVQALLTELANRTPGSCPAELPLWLVEAVAAELLSTIGPDLVLETNPLISRLSQPGGELVPSLRYQKYSEHRRELQKYLNTHPPLTFNGLCLPTPDLLTPDQRPHYTASAQVFFTELWALPNGRAMFLKMIENLPRTLNWQTAFLAAFQSTFLNLADVEKWWAVTATQFTGRTEARVWPLAETLARLEQALTQTVDVRRSSDGKPSRETVSIQRVLSEMELQRQLPVLRSKQSQLQLVQNYAPPALLPLVNSYLGLLAEYLEQRAKAGYNPMGKHQPVINVGVLVRSTIARLNALDTQRAAAKQTLQSGPSSNAGEAAPAGGTAIPSTTGAAGRG